MRLGINFNNSLWFHLFFYSAVVIVLNLRLNGVRHQFDKFSRVIATKTSFFYFLPTPFILELNSLTTTYINPIFYELQRH